MALRHIQKSVKKSVSMSFKIYQLQNVRFVCMLRAAIFWQPKKALNENGRL